MYGKHIHKTNTYTKQISKMYTRLVTWNERESTYTKQISKMYTRLWTWNEREALIPSPQSCVLITTVGFGDDLHPIIGFLRETDIGLKITIAVVSGFNPS